MLYSAGHNQRIKSASYSDRMSPKFTVVDYCHNLLCAFSQWHHWDVTQTLIQCHMMLECLTISHITHIIWIWCCINIACPHNFQKNDIWYEIIGNSSSYFVIFSQLSTCFQMNQNKTSTDFGKCWQIMTDVDLFACFCKAFLLFDLVWQISKEIKVFDMFDMMPVLNNMIFKWHF